MKMSDWKLIETLYTCKNITRTAERLFLAQPTVSKRIQLVEEELGVTLLQRSTHGISFTEDGEYIAVKASQINAILSEIEHHIAESKAAPTGTIRLGSTNAVTRSSLPELLRSFRLKHPGYSVDLTIRHSSVLADLVSDGSLDLALINGDLPFQGEKMLYKKEQGYIACSFALDFDHLQNYPYITYKKDPYTDILIKTWWDQHYHAETPHGLTVDHGDLARELVLKGLGYCFFFAPEYMQGHESCIHMLTNLDGSPLIRNTWLIFSKHAKKNAAVQAFIENLTGPASPASPEVPPTDS